ncbi:MAG TPA: PBP1A family penicillin-binding protein [Nitrospiraceae bacterium]|nr:PBP1A family penicillin-binding protein [Nitrospiraceae bacterium]
MPSSDRFVELRPSPLRWPWWKITLLVLGVLTVLVVGTAVGAVWYLSQDLPSLDSLQEYQPSLVSRVYSDDRQVIGQFYIERRLLTPLADIPQNLTQAVIAVEDARFFEHPGLDVIGMLRATWTNLRRRGRVEGASTITQQLARSLFLSPERTFVRKFKELILAYKIEVILSKDQILEMYLNQIYFGQGAYGVAAAAQTYFGKELARLNLAESAFLAGLPKSPSNYSPYKYPERAKKRQEHVLARMEEAGSITAAEQQEAVAQLMSFRRPGSEQIAPYFIENVRQHLVAKYGETMVYKGGLEVFTTLNSEMQKAAERAVYNGLRQLDKRQGWRGPLDTKDITTLVDKTATTTASTLQEGDLLQGIVTKVGKDHVVVLAGSTEGRLALDDMVWARRRLKGRDLTKDVTVLSSPKQVLKPGDVIEVAVKKVGRDGVQFRLEQTPVVEGALVALDPRTGAIRAMVGGYDFGRSEYNRAVIAHRQAGSAFKPIIYATALNRGSSPSTVVVDAPVVYEEEDTEKIWKPENYEKRFFGVISLREALIHSRNLATVRLLERVGIRPVIEFSKSLGITSPLNPDLSLALGSSSVGLLELTSAYGVFANQGIRLDPYSIATVQDANGHMLEQTLFEPRQVLSNETAYLITNMLEDVIQRGTGQLAKSIGRPIAGKTGTTNDYTDAWFIGYTPNLAVGIWVGFDDIRTLGETESGAHAALPIWVEFMKEALKKLPVVPFEIPDDIQFVRVDPSTGLLASDQGDHAVVELFSKGTEPTQSAPVRIDPTDFYKLDQVQDGQGAAAGVPR